MKLPLRRLRPIAQLGLVAFLLLAALVVGEAQSDRSGPDFQALRERWQQKSASERQELRRRFAELERLSPQDREELVRRARDLRGSLQALDHDPPAWVRSRLEGAAPRERQHELRRCLEEHHRRRGSGLRERMPPEVLERLEGARTDEERAAVLRAFFQEARQQMVPHFIDRAGRRLGLTAEEVKGLQAQAAAGGEDVLAHLKRRLIEHRGRPEGIDEADWEAWQALPDEEFVRRVELSGALWPHRFRGGPGRRGSKPGHDREGRRGGDWDGRDPDGREHPRGEAPPRGRGGPADGL